MQDDGHRGPPTARRASMKLPNTGCPNC